jgi:hypothetical protein
MRTLIFLFLFAACLLISCQSSGKRDATPPKADKLFTLLPASYTGIDFVNQVDYDDEYNCYTYRSFYNGGGVGVGDINNDGLMDVFFCGNRQPSKLYLNKGDFRFEDITEKAGVACKGVWATGVMLADINGDGWLDIYVCKSGKPGGDNRYNELFINNGDLTFTEKAKDWGIADMGLSVHAAFFDYDRDGDLDCYLLNNSLRTVGGYDLIRDQRDTRDTAGGNKLYRNELIPAKGLTSGEHFTDISEAAGIYGSAIGFGLGVTIGDINRDGWQDIYVSNDFFEKDYLYINDQQGGFEESLEKYLQEISMGSMGADMADLTNDGYPEIFVTEMLPPSDARYKTKASFEDWNKYQRNITNGYHRQFPRNVLQLNQGNGTFSEIGRYAGVEATDWSWGALLFDMDNDGWKDIFVANGIYKDLLDQDYINFYAAPDAVRAMIQKEGNVIKKLVDSIPSEAQPNYAFRNTGPSMIFENKAASWGLDQPSFSNGSAYCDFDNDGDLDLVVNNVNMPSFLYRNNSETRLPENNKLTIELKGTAKNLHGLGAQVTLYAGDKIYYQELAPMRGFQSTVTDLLHFGLGNITQLDSITVQWLDGKKSLLKEVKSGQRLIIKQQEATAGVFTGNKPPAKPVFSVIKSIPGLDFVHRENEFNDFDRDRLLFQMVSTEGPHFAIGDVNQDGRKDFYIGNARDATGAMYLSRADGSFFKSNMAVWEKDSPSEDTDAIFFDADQDGDDDLYITSGGNEFNAGSNALKNRLYFNDGKGNFTRSSQSLPTFNYESASCVRPADYDGDGDLDLFVGIRLRPYLYGVPANGYILQNDGKGFFTNVTGRAAPELSNVGMITDAVWTDLDNDKDPDLVVVGDFMPVSIFINDKKSLRKLAGAFGQQELSGNWHRIKAFDADRDGDTDLVIGNHGLNSRLEASFDHPLEMLVNDFDGNGQAEQITCMYNGEKSYPLVQRQDLLAQLPFLKKKYLYFKNYKEQTIQDIFSPQQLQNAYRWKIQTMESIVLLNQGQGKFEVRSLPWQAQLFPVYAIEPADFDGDGKTDLLLGGNLYRARPETGIYAAGHGLLLKGDGKGNFIALSAEQSGILIDGEIRDFSIIQQGKSKLLLVAMNNDKIKTYRF